MAAASAGRGAPRPAFATRALRLALILAALVSVATLGWAPAATATPDRAAAPARASAATGGCAPVGGGATDVGGGPSRATVVVDTGSGPVWSACISFSGTISGIAALEAARSTITDLAPVYETYSGEGRAVCALRGVGSSPPNCLGAQASYWAYFRNGAYARGGASSSKVRDGDVEGWRYGTGSSPPRAATAGTRAVAAPPPTTAAPTTAAPAPTAGPAPTAAPSPGVGSTPTTVPNGAATTSTSVAGADGSTTTTVAAGSTSTAPPASTTITSTTLDPGTGDAGGGSSSPAGGPVDDEGDGGSSAASAVGFGVAVLVLVAVGLVARRRRRGPASLPTEPIDAPAADG